ncbi:MAG TPA: hypothetical protein VF331_07805 [Polyangiales bacterium]
MRDKPYPLQAAQTLRAHEEAAAQAALDAARTEVAQAQAALQAARAQLATQQAERRAPPEAGLSTGSELARAGAYARGLAAQTPQLTHAVQEAKAQLLKALRAEQLAQLALQTAHAGQKLLERHHERFDTLQRKVAERDALDETEDQAAARRRPAR